MKLIVIKDGRYPDYSLVDDSDLGEVIEVDPEFYEEYKRVMRMYGELQDKLEEMYADETLY